jgi:hypothetical protein
VFEVERAHQISLLTETETLLRYLCERHTHKLDPHGQHNAILFFDFGGHRMVKGRPRLRFWLKS